MTEPTEALPIADLEPRTITLDEYMALTPEKLELLSGYLLDEPGEPASRLRLLALLLVNCGLVDAVRLAPRARWTEALERAYGALG